MNTITVKEKTLELNEDGFLTKPEEWDRDVAAYIAAIEGIEMTEEHWEVVNFLRSYYLQYRTAPRVKVLTREIGNKLGPKANNSRYLYKLYPCGPAKQACKIAGLPRDTGCV